uniref:Uncharacterized protein n=1 Tax=Chromera velia CCMP2878 TaxID=1169474 RepID=A0A0G4G2L9_9ALVE|eukprot:Cvel_4113.t1-p1 / transcript=Cvel_4113.t1 / gene=Cvel_4113 / organism=Chromera_velia_CCMP2878 / gene_product=hypothetical protein / transcript_product=hypothetical protein / location=Cvel_scaffold175:82763-83519(+) / protein_length=125 / sequence_SO=supercontig / SO=protein_coding / is_pseudo=false
MHRAPINSLEGLRALACGDPPTTTTSTTTLPAEGDGDADSESERGASKNGRNTVMFALIIVGVVLVATFLAVFIMMRQRRLKLAAAKETKKSAPSPTHVPPQAAEEVSETLPPSPQAEGTKAGGA